jgi:hypothetical protein
LLPAGDNGFCIHLTNQYFLIHLTAPRISCCALNAKVSINDGAAHNAESATCQGHQYPAALIKVFIT